MIVVSVYTTATIGLISITFPTYYEKNVLLTPLNILIVGAFFLSSCHTSSMMTMASESIKEQTEASDKLKCNPILPGLLDKRCNKNYQLGQCDIREATLKNGLESRGAMLSVVEEELNDCINDLENCRNTLVEPPLPNMITPRETYFGMGGMAIGVLGLWTYQKLVGTKKAPEKIRSIPTVRTNEPLSTITEEPPEQPAGDNREEERTRKIEEDIREIANILLENSERTREVFEESHETKIALQAILAATESIAQEHEELKSRLSEVESVTKASNAKKQE